MTSNIEIDCQHPDTINYQDHWNNAYAKTQLENLGWYEEKSIATIQLIQKTKLPLDGTILNVGSGSSTLIDDLLELGYTNIIVNDISSDALNALENRLGNTGDKVQYIVDDLTNPTKLQELSTIDLWNDRAVLHFFVTENQRTAYFDLLKKVVQKNGFVIISTFAVDGAKKCCGLEVCQYDPELLSNYLGNDFKLLEAFNYTFTNSNGDSKPYVYTLFKRVQL